MTDEILIRFSVKDDGSPVIEKVNKKLGETKKQSQELVPGLEKARGSLTSFVGANAGLIAILTGVGVALGSIIKSQVEYANEVRNIAMITGQSAEETSRLIQVLDDYKISQDDIANSARAMKEKGLVPTIETLAQLSDQYLAIEDPAKRYQFAQDNLGRSAAKYTELLLKGSKAILAQGDAVAEGLLLNQKQLDDARKLEMAQDALGESWEQLSIKIGSKAVPALTGVVDEFNHTTRAIEIMKEKGLNPFVEMLVSGDGYINALKQAADETAAQREAMLKSAGAIDTNTQSLEENKDALKAITDANQAMLGLIDDVQSAEESYHERAVALNDERIEIEQKRAEEIAKGWAADASKIAEYDQALVDNTAAAAENASAHEEATARILLGLAERKMMQDGILTDDEMNWLLEKGVAWGVYEQDVITKAQNMQREIDDLTTSIANVPENKTITFTANFVNQGVPAYVAANYASDWSQHASGGTFMIPPSYGFEGFRMGGGDTASGGEKLTITPKNQDVIDYKKLARTLRDAIKQMGG